MLQLVLEKIPLLALCAVSSIVTFLAQRGAIGWTEQLPISARINNALVSYIVYIRQMFWPARLAVFYPHPENRLPLFGISLAVILLIGITVAAFIFRKKAPYFITGWLWYLGMLVPVIGLVQVGWQGHADRYTYLPQIGLYIAVTWAVTDLTRSWRFQHDSSGRCCPGCSWCSNLARAGCKRLTGGIAKRCLPMRSLLPATTMLP